MAKTIKFNTGRPYAADGQVIKATLHDDGVVTFMDHSRSIDGGFTMVESLASFGPDDVMFHYDRGLYVSCQRSRADGLYKGGCNTLLVETEQAKPESTRVTGFAVTFERYLPHDDADDICEADESGFVVQDVSLGDALREGLEVSRPEYAGHCEPDCYPARGVRWLTFTTWNHGTLEHIAKGISESRALHIPDNVTESSRARICRLFKAYGTEKRQ